MLTLRQFFLLSTHQFKLLWILLDGKVLKYQRKKYILSDSPKYICFIQKSSVWFHGNRMNSLYSWYDWMVYLTDPVQPGLFYKQARWLSDSWFVEIYSKHCQSQTRRARESWNFESMFILLYVSCVMSHVSHVTCHMSRVTCHKKYYFFVHKKKIKNKI